MQFHQEFFNYFFLKPTGHLGLRAETFFVVLPLTQVIVVLFGTAFVVTTGVGVGDAAGVGSTF